MCPTGLQIFWLAQLQSSQALGCITSYRRSLLTMLLAAAAVADYHMCRNFGTYLFILGM